MSCSRFRGEIVGVGSTSGVRVVVGRWMSSPLGPFADAMVETAMGHRVLVAPSRQVADFVRATYRFDEVRIEEVQLEGTAAPGWSVRSPSLSLDLTFGRRTVLGLLLRLVPVQVAESPAWCTVTDPVARVALRGVRTRGTAGGGRREWYGATDHRVVTAMSGCFDGGNLGDLRSVSPSPRFGFSSTPARPSITRVVTTVSEAWSG